MNNSLALSFCACLFWAEEESGIGEERRSEPLQGAARIARGQKHEQQKLMHHYQECSSNRQPLHKGTLCTQPQEEELRRWTQVHYVSLAGISIDFDDLSDGLTELALSLEELRETAATAGQEALAEGITSLVGNLAAIAPDSEALDP